MDKKFRSTPSKSQSFADYHTYAWGNANEIKDSILAQVAKQSVDSGLQDKGLRQVNEGQNPNLIVTSNGGMKQETSIPMTVYAFLLYGAQAHVAAQIENFVKFPPRQKAASFNLDTVRAQLGPAIMVEKAKEEAARKESPGGKGAMIQ